MEKKCIINTTESMFSQMIAYIVKTLNIGVVVTEQHDLQGLLNEVNDTCKPYVIFDPHIFTFELEKICKQIFSKNPDTVLICICKNTCNKFLGLRLYKSGVNCVICNMKNTSHLIGILKNAFAGIDYYPTEVLDAIKKREHILMRDFCSTLSTRELEVLHMFAEKEPIKAIAQCLQITESTVSTTLHRIIRKLGVDTRSEAVELVRTQGAFGD